MTIKPSHMLFTCIAACASILTTLGCEEKPNSPATPAPKPQATGTPSPAPTTSAPTASTPASTNNHADHAHAPGDTHAHDHTDGHSHGPTTLLGKQSIAGFSITASRDGTVSPGGDAAVDFLITSDSSKPAAVRCWIGTQDAKGSIKAKAALEGAQWHTHVEVPNPLPPESKLWVELEDANAQKHTLAFDLKS